MAAVVWSSLSTGWIGAAGLSTASVAIFRASAREIRGGSPPPAKRRT